MNEIDSILRDAAKRGPWHKHGTIRNIHGECPIVAALRVRGVTHDIENRCRPYELAGSSPEWGDIICAADGVEYHPEDPTFRNRIIALRARIIAELIDGQHSVESLTARIIKRAMKKEINHA